MPTELGYILVTQHAECGEPEPCQGWCDAAKNQHAVKLVPRGTKFTSNLGSLHQAMGRFSKHHPIAYVVTMEEPLRQLYSDDELAAYAVGGLQAMHKVVKAKAAEVRKQERLQLKQLRKLGGLP